MRRLAGTAGARHADRPLHRHRGGLASDGRHRSSRRATSDGSFVALKLATTRVGARAGRARGAHTARARSAMRLRPELRRPGADGGQRWCASRWMRGAAVRAAAAELRDAGSTAGLLALCGRIARAYAALHARGVVHGQVHPRHVLVDGDGARRADRLLGRSVGLRTRRRRHGSRRASARSARRSRHGSLLRGGAVALTPAAEQYSVAALLYLLVTGRMYARLRLEREALPRDIADASPLPFSEHGLAARPELEAVLGARTAEGSRPPLRVDGRSRRGARGARRASGRLARPPASSRPPRSRRC